MKKLNQKGFSHYMVLALVAILIAVGGAGYYVWQKNDTDTSTETVADTSSVEAKYLEITEFGVRIKLPADLEDMTYAIKTNSSGDKYAVLSTTSLAELEPDCAADNVSSSGVEGFGMVISFKSLTDPGPYEGTSTMADAYPDAVMVGNRYYAIAPAVQAPCYDPNVYDYDTSEVGKKNTAGVRFLKEAILEKI